MSNTILFFLFFFFITSFDKFFGIAIETLLLKNKKKRVLIGLYILIQRLYTRIYGIWSLYAAEKCQNKEFMLVRIFPYLD